MTWQAVVLIGIAVFGLGGAAGYWARGARNRADLAVIHEHETTGPRGWRVYLRRAPAGPLRARPEAAQADAERLEGEL